MTHGNITFVIFLLSLRYVHPIHHTLLLLQRSRGSKCPTVYSHTDLTRGAWASFRTSRTESHGSWASAGRATTSAGHPRSPKQPNFHSHCTPSSEYSGYPLHLVALRQPKRPAQAPRTTYTYIHTPHILSYPALPRHSPVSPSIPRCPESRCVAIHYCSLCARCRCPTLREIPAYSRCSGRRLEGMEALASRSEPWLPRRCL